MAFDVTNLSIYWPRPYVGGPRHGEYHDPSFVSLPDVGYSPETLIDRDGNVVVEMQLHDSVTTKAEFHRLLGSLAG